MPPRESLTLTEVLTLIRKDIAAAQEWQKRYGAKIDMLNDWHLQVNGALKLLVFLAGSGIATTIILKFVGV